jgi:hypothetical protein
MSDIVLSYKYQIITVLCLALFLTGCALFPSSGDTPYQSRWDPTDSSYGDVEMGMKMRDVKTSWGDPDQVETSGNQTFGNQRWVYPADPTQGYGLRARRVVYFEQGKVVGWETVDSDSSFMY